MKIRLSDHFTYRKLIKFTLPSIAMMIFTSVYGVVDGFFVSNYAGKTPAWIDSYAFIGIYKYDTGCSSCNSASA